MEQKPGEETASGPVGDRDSGRAGEAWRARVTADLLASRDRQQRLWGGIDEQAMARFVEGLSDDAERARIEKVLHEHPALRESLEITQELAPKWLQTGPAKQDAKPDQTGENGSGQDAGEKPRTRVADRPDGERGKVR